jgi:hypothetical protein
MTAEPTHCETCCEALTESEPTSPCSGCRAKALIAALPADLLARVDHAVLTQHPLQAVMYVRVYRPGLAVYEGLDVIHLRYAQLRESRPDDFSCADDIYWVQKEP